MNTGEKVAWLELVVSLSAIVVVTALFPWLGNRATAAFGLLGLVGLAALLVRQRGNEVVLDERDREIIQRSTGLGVHSAWMLLMVAVVSLVIWSSYHDREAVPVAWLTWLVWVQFSICYAVKGVVGVLSYRGDRHAS